MSEVTYKLPSGTGMGQKTQSKKIWILLLKVESVGSMQWRPQGNKGEKKAQQWEKEGETNVNKD